MSKQRADGVMYTEVIRILYQIYYLVKYQTETKYNECDSVESWCERAGGRAQTHWKENQTPKSIL